MKVRKLLLSVLSTLCFGFVTFVMTACNTNSFDTSSEEPPHEHNWTEIERTSATCTKRGTVTYLCVECEETKSLVIEFATGHSEVIDEAVAATCKATGLTEGKHCSECGEVLVTQEVVPTSGHEYSYICGYCGQINETYYTNGLEFTLLEDGSSYSVSKYNNKSINTDTNVIIPSIYKEKPVTSIGDHAFDNRLIKSITIPNSITSIGEAAFLYCTALTSITIPDSVTSIGDSAFFKCWQLKTITIPDSVTSIGVEAFRGCSSLTSVTIGNGVTSIGEGTFYECSSLKSITIPNRVTSIGKQAFWDCSLLTTVTIGDGVMNIGSNAFFAFCSSLTTVCYTGTEKQWNSITIEIGNEYLTNANIIYNYKG